MLYKKLRLKKSDDTPIFKVFILLQFVVVCVLTFDSRLIILFTAFIPNFVANFTMVYRIDKWLYQTIYGIFLFGMPLSQILDPSLHSSQEKTRGLFCHAL